jgi:hypothetical protein
VLYLHDADNVARHFLFSKTGEINVCEAALGIVCFEKLVTKLWLEEYKI